MIKQLLVLAIIVTVGVAYGDEYDNQQALNAYIGGEGKLTQFKDSYPDMSLRTRMPGVGIVAGLRLNSHLGLEVGTHTSRKTYDRFIKKVYHRAHYGAVMGYVPLTGITLIGGGGMSHTVISTGGTRAHRAIPRVMAGIMYPHTEKLYIRYMMTWERMSKFYTNTPYQLMDGLHHQIGWIYTF